MFELSVERATTKQTSLLQEFNQSFSCAIVLSCIPHAGLFFMSRYFFVFNF